MVIRGRLRAMSSDAHRGVSAKALAQVAKAMSPIVATACVGAADLRQSERANCASVECGGCTMEKGGKAVHQVFTKYP